MHNEALAEALQTFTLKAAAPAGLSHAVVGVCFAFSMHRPLIYRSMPALD
jgi:hypothetical protein